MTLEVLHTMWVSSSASAYAIHHPCMSECAVTQSRRLRRNKPLKLCFLLSHTHLTKAVKSMVGMVSDKDVLRDISQKAEKYPHAFFPPVMISSFLFIASPSAGAVAVRRQRPRLFTGSYSSVDKCAAMEASRLSRVPGSTR